MKDGKAVLDTKVDITAIIQAQQAYLDDFEKNPPERFKERKPMFTSMRPEFHPGNLSLVAFVQNDDTKAVLQSQYLRLGDQPTSSATRK